MKFTIEVPDPTGRLDSKIVLAELRATLDQADTGDHQVIITQVCEKFAARVKMTVVADLDIEAHTEADAYTIAQAYLGNLETSADMVRDMDLADYGACDELESGDDWSCKTVKQDSTDRSRVVELMRSGR